MPYDFNVDFSPLASLPKLYREAQQQAQRDAALEQFRQNPNMPFDQVARTLIGGGAIAEGATLAGLQNQALQRALQERAQTETERAHRANEGLSREQFQNTVRHQTFQENQPRLVGSGGALVDPNTNKPVYENNSGLLDPQTVSEMAKQARAGDASVFTNIGRGAQSSQNLALLRAEITRQNLEAGRTGADQAQQNAEYQGMRAGQRSIGTQEARMGTAAFEAEGAINLARDAIKKVPRTGFLPFNKLIEGYQRQTLSPDQAELFTRTQGVVNTYAAVMARGANITTDSARHRAEELLQTASDPAVYNRVLDTMLSEIDMAKNSPERMRNFYRAKYKEGAVSTPQKANSISDFANATGDSGWTDLGNGVRIRPK